MQNKRIQPVRSKRREAYFTNRYKNQQIIKLFSCLWDRIFSKKNLKKNILSLLLMTIPFSKNSILLTPNISQLANQDLEKLPRKNKKDSREHVLGARIGLLGSEFEAEEWFYNKSGKVAFQSGKITKPKKFRILDFLKKKIKEILMNFFF